MNYIKWLALLPVMLVLTALAFPLAFVLPAFAELREGSLDNATRWGKGWYLPSWLNWFQTPDNSLDGDNGWRTEHWQWRYRLRADLCTYVGRVGWLWRNPGYGVGLVKFDSATPITATFTGNQAVNDSPGVEGTCHVYAGGLWMSHWLSLRLFLWTWQSTMPCDSLIPKLR